MKSKMKWLAGVLAALTVILSMPAQTVLAYNYTPIMNSPTTTVVQMEHWFCANASYPSFYKNSDAPTITAFCQMYYDECVAEGVDPAVAFCQAMKETDYLKYDGRIPVSSYNFGGLGAEDDKAGAYETFSSVRQGIRAQVQHLKAYGSTDSLNNTCVDARFSLVSRGSAVYVEWLGIHENPSGGGWASDTGYGYSIVNDYMAQLYTHYAYTGNLFYIKNSLSSGNADQILAYGKDTDEVYIGDWNGDGKDTICVRRGNTYYIKNSLTDGDADCVLVYGKDTDEVYIGDWNGDGKDTICVRRGNIYYFKNSLTGGKADVVISYGKDTDEVYVGDWDGDGKDTLCVRRENLYYFKNSLTGGREDVVISYGKNTDTVLVGDWNGDERDTICVRRNNLYYISNRLHSGSAQYQISYGRYSDEIFIGDWDGDGADTFCVRR